MSSKYNGWTNYETWNFNLWITNEEGDYDYATELARDSKDKYALSESLQDWASEMANDVLSSYEYAHGFITDMVNSSVKEVNFHEVAKHLWEDRTQRMKERSELWGEE